MGILRGLVGALLSSASTAAKPDAAEVRVLIERQAFAEADKAIGLLARGESRAEELAAIDCLRGELAYARRQDDIAEARFRASLSVVPGLPAAHHGLSLVLAARDLFEDAIRHAHFAMQTDPKNPRYLAQVGYCHLCVNNFQMAELPLRRASFLAPENAYVWNNLGIVLRAKGDGKEARACFERAIRVKPGFEDAVNNLARLEHDQATGEFRPTVSLDTTFDLKAALPPSDEPRLQPVAAAEAAGDFQRAIDLAEALLLDRADDVTVVAYLASLHERSGDAASAVDVLSAFLVDHPDDQAAIGSLGLIHLRAQDYLLAAPLLERASTSAPEHIDYLVGWARALSGQHLFAQAGALFEQACERRPDDIGILNQYASNLANRCQYAQAIEVIDRLRAAGVLVSCVGTVLANLGRMDEALDAFDADVAKHPLDASIRFQRGTLRLLLGDYEHGWDDYACRGLGSSTVFRTLPFPVWRGEPLEGKAVIIVAEQGLGDQVMFASCLPDLLARHPRRVVLEVFDRIAPTLARSFQNIEVVATKQGNDLDWVRAYPDTDFAIHLGDLPGAFRRRLEDFPRHQGFLVADPSRVAHWRSMLGRAGPGPYIGVTWRGGTELTRSPLRSMQARQLAPLRACTEGSFICLQYNTQAEELEQAAAAGLPLLHWPEAIADLDEFAALVSALDLVVTVCNTTVHYAGALAKPTWVMAPRCPEWRYGYSGTAMPWYPSVVVMRQHDDGNWAGLLDEVCRELTRWSARMQPATSEPTGANGH